MKRIAIIGAGSAGLAVAKKIIETEGLEIDPVILEGLEEPHPGLEIPAPKEKFILTDRRCLEYYPIKGSKYHK